MRKLEQVIGEEVSAEERVASFAYCGTSATGFSSVMGEEGSHIVTVGGKLVPKAARTRLVQAIAAVIRIAYEQRISIHITSST